MHNIGVNWQLRCLCVTFKIDKSNCSRGLDGVHRAYAMCAHELAVNVEEVGIRLKILCLNKMINWNDDHDADTNQLHTIHFSCQLLMLTNSLFSSIIYFHTLHSSTDQEINLVR